MTASVQQQALGNVGHKLAHAPAGNADQFAHAKRGRGQLDSGHDGGNREDQFEFDHLRHFSVRHGAWRHEGELRGVVVDGRHPRQPSDIDAWRTSSIDHVAPRLLSESRHIAPEGDNLEAIQSAPLGRAWNCLCGGTFDFSQRSVNDFRLAQFHGSPCYTALPSTELSAAASARALSSRHSRTTTAPSRVACSSAPSNSAMAILSDAERSTIAPSKKTGFTVPAPSFPLECGGPDGRRAVPLPACASAVSNPLYPTSVTP
jgi:hypothetical protein